MKYRKRPIVIEAFQMRYVPDEANKTVVYLGDPFPSWFIEALEKSPEHPGAVYIHKNMVPVIKTLEGVMEISSGDYVIRGVQQELYPCKPDIFESTYESVSESEETE